MADPANLFDDDKTGTTPLVNNTPPPTADPFADKLAGIKGADGKPKYANTSVALEALIASQNHIATLEAEAVELRKNSENVASLEEVIARLRNEGTNKEVTTPNLDENKINQLVRSALEERERQSASQANLKRVNDALIQKYGTREKAAEVVAQKATELGTSVADLGALSSANPTLVLQLFGTTPAVNSNPINTSIRTSSELNPPPELKAPEKSLISGVGATDANRKEFMRKIKEDVYKRLEVTT